MNKVGNFKKKIKNSRGESIAETLVAVLISAMAMTILAGAIGAAGKVGLAARKAYVYMDSENGSSEKISADITIEGESIENIQVYKDSYENDGSTINYYYWTVGNEE